MTDTEPLPRRYGWRITRTALLADVIAVVCLTLPAVLIVDGFLPTGSPFYIPILIAIPGFGFLVWAVGEGRENHEKTVNRLEQGDNL